MRPFTFRPAAVLELRRRQEETARDVLARAHAERTRAEAGLAAALEAVTRARQAFRADLQTANAVARAGWHRSWIERLLRDVDVRRRVAAMAADVVARASAAVRDAMQQRRVLERLRDRTWRRYQVESPRAELQEMDRLAGLRYAAAAAELRESASDDQSDHGRDRLADVHHGRDRHEEGSARP
jgi:flagellar FliJ protein